MKSRRRVSDAIAGMAVTSDAWNAALRAAERTASRLLGSRDAEMDVVAADAAMEALASGVVDPAMAGRVAAHRARLRAIDIIRRRRGRACCLGRGRMDPLLAPRSEIPIEAVAASQDGDRHPCPLQEVEPLLRRLPRAEQAAIARSLSASRPPLSGAERQARHRAIERLRSILRRPADNA